MALNMNDTTYISALANRIASGESITNVTIMREKGGSGIAGAIASGIILAKAKSEAQGLVALRAVPAAPSTPIIPSVLTNPNTYTSILNETYTKANNEAKAALNTNTDNLLNSIFRPKTPTANGNLTTQQIESGTTGNITDGTGSFKIAGMSGTNLLLMVGLGVGAFFALRRI